jgi:DNA mismatch repair protein MutS
MAEAGATTPLLEQYEGVRAQYPGHLVLFRVGDFYECFGEDAKLLARELEITLTARAPDTRGERTPMAGVPHHAVDSYLVRLLRKGYKVALCDQVEDARLAKGLVRREVTRVVTPGTVVEERVLAGPEHNFLGAVELDGEVGRYAAVDLTTGEWLHEPGDGPGLPGLLAAVVPLAPRELLVVDGPHAPALERALKAELPGLRLERAPVPLPLEELPSRLRGPGATGESPPALLDRRLAAYVKATAPRLLPHVAPVVRGSGSRRLRLDARTLRHLEITRPMNPDDPEGATLLASWAVAATPPGRRTLSFWLRNPLADPTGIRERLDAVEVLMDRGASLASLRSQLAGVGDLGRIAGRLAGRRLRPSELANLRDGLAVGARLAEGERGSPSALLARISESLTPSPVALDLLTRGVPEQPPNDPHGPGRLRPGFDEAVDREGARERAALAEIAGLEREEQEATGIRTLKIGYNQVFGYYLEVSRPNLAKVPERYRRKQTIANGERFVTERLREIEQRLAEAREAATTAEAAAWERLLAALDAEVAGLQRVSRSLGELDVLSGFAEAAQRWGLVRPEVDDGPRIQLRAARHPVLDRRLGGRFVPNDLDLDADGARLLVLTGPNMSGKSTVMRTVGLLVVLAQAGSFVPAKFARIGVVDALHTRMGFTDEIGRGKSSFMVEMSEVAEILRGAGPRSLVLLDEVGRGTSTFDGLALAWATLRYLHDRARCRTIVATHYHQLTELVAGLDGAANAHLAVREQGEEIVFLHRLVPGSTDRSYGLHVARLAGLPKELTDEADRLLRRLEEGGVGLFPTGRGGARSAPARYTQAVLLAAEPAPASALEAELRALDVDRLSPIEALRWLDERRRRLRPDAPPMEPR